MPIVVDCACGQRHETPDRSAGLTFTCYRCLAPVLIPKPGEEPAPAPPAEPVADDGNVPVGQNA